MNKLILLILAITARFVAVNAQPCSIPSSFFPEDTIVVCSGSSVQVTAPQITGATYSWSTAEGGNPVTISFSGTYRLTISDGVCFNTDSITVLFNSFLLSPVVSDLKLCKGQATRPLPVTGQNLLWYTGPLGGVGSTIAPLPSTLDTSTTVYWVSQTLKGCESPRLPVEVKVIDKPGFELGQAFIIPCNATGVVLQVIPDGESEYTWSNGSADASIIAPGRGQYWLYAQNMCGNHRDTVVAVECRDKCVQFPTAFTPNQDGKNDKYQAACFCPVPMYRLVIYNRNGEVVYQTTNPSASWDGYFKGKPQPSGVYVFYSEYFDFVLKQNQVEKGTLVLVR